MPRWPGDDMTDGVWMSWWIDSVKSLDELHETALSLGYVVTMPPTNESWGVREFLGLALAASIGASGEREAALLAKWNSERATARFDGRYIPHGQGAWTDAPS